MKQLTFYLFFTLLSFSAKAQNKPFTEIMAGGGHTQMRFSNSLGSLNRSFNIEKQFFFGSRVGFHYGTYWDDNTIFKMGINITTTGEKNFVSGLKWGSEHDGNGGWKPDPNLPHEATETNREYWFEIPFTLHNEFKKKKWTAYYELSLMPTIFYGSSSSFLTDGGQKMNNFSKSNSFKRFGIGGATAIGTNYTLKNDKKIFIQSSFSTQIFGRRNFAAGATFGRFSLLLDIEMGIQFPL